MPSYLTYKYLGDKRAAKVLRHAGLHQLGILKNAMRFQNLQQNRRVVEFSDGTWIICTSVFNLDTVNIYVPPLLPIGGERKVIKEEFCFCSTYFTEGRILAIYNESAKEGNDAPYYNRYKYYDEVFNNKLTPEEDYNGVRYLVGVCRGIKGRDKNLICASVDLTTYAVGDTVILFCTGDYSVLESTRSQYPFDDALEVADPCPGKTNNCFSCSADTKTVVGDGLEGTYVIVPLSFTRTTNDAGDTFKLVTASQLEAGELYLCEVPSENSISTIIYFTEAIDFTNNIVRVKTITGQAVDAEVICNVQALQDYSNRVRIVYFSYIYQQQSTINLLTLKTGEDYSIIGFRFNTPVRCPDETFRLIFKAFADSQHTPPDIFRYNLLWNIDSGSHLDIIKGATWQPDDTKWVELGEFLQLFTEATTSPTQIYTTPPPDPLTDDYTTVTEFTIDKVYFSLLSQAHDTMLAVPYEYLSTYVYEYSETGAYPSTQSTTTANTTTEKHPVTYCAAIDKREAILQSIFTAYNPQPLYFKDYVGNVEIEESVVTTVDGEGYFVVTTDSEGEHSYVTKYYDNLSATWFTYTYYHTIDSSVIARNNPLGTERTWEFTWHRTLDVINEPVHDIILPVYDYDVAAGGFLHIIVCQDWSYDVSGSDSGTGYPEEIPEGGSRPAITRSNAEVKIIYYTIENIIDIADAKLSNCTKITTGDFIDAVREAVYVFFTSAYADKDYTVQAYKNFSISNT